MKIYKSDLIAIAVIAFALFGDRIQWPKLDFATGTNTPAPVVNAPSAELQTLLAPAKAILATHPQRVEFSQWSLATADMLTRDGGKVVKTASVLQTYNADAVSLRFVGQFTPATGLAAAINQAMLSWVGKDPGELDVGRRQKAIEFYNALAWAAGS